LNDVANIIQFPWRCSWNRSFSRH